MSDARTSMLDRIRTALGDGPRPALPPIDAADAGAPAYEDRGGLARRFARELERVGGQARFVAREEDLPDAIAALVRERDLGAASTDYATAGYALLRAEALFADTGSALVIERSALRGMAPYLPRTCVIVADAAVLHPTLSAAALAPAFDAARGRDRGEAVIITGPSRTADIEKTIVLGAHGPKDVVVFVFGVGPSPAEVEL